MEKSSSPKKALLCAALLLVLFISFFLPVVSFNSAEKFEGETKLGYYYVDLEHAGNVNVSLFTYLFSTGDDVDTVVELYKLTAKRDAESNASKKAEIQKQIDYIASNISDADNESIQIKLNDNSFLKEVALRAAMYDAKDDSSKITFVLIVSLIAFSVLILDITLKLVKYFKEKREINDSVTKAFADFRLPIISFILRMFTVQYYIDVTRGIVSLGAGIKVGLVAMVLFAVLRCLDSVFEAQLAGGEKYKKTIIKQSITVCVLIITVVISLLGMKMSGLMINDMQSHYPEFKARYLEYAIKTDPVLAMEKVEGSMSIVVAIIAAIPLLAHAALGYMLARVGVVEKTRITKKRAPKTPLGSFYIGFIFVAVTYILTLLVFSVNDSAKRYDMYENCQMSVVFTEYKDESSAEYAKYNALSSEKDVLTELEDLYNDQYEETDDNQMMADIESDIEDVQLEIEALENQMDRIESRKKSNIILIIVFAVLAIAAEVAFKAVKFEAEKIADSGKEN